MDDNTRELVQLGREAIQHADKSNKRFFIIAIVLCVTIFLTITGITACYFFSDYQYPTTTQEQSSAGIKQTIGKGE